MSAKVFAHAPARGLAAAAAFSLALAVCAAPAQGLAAKPPSRSAPARDGFSGVWWPKPGTADFKPDPVLTPEAQATWDHVRAEMKLGHVIQDSTAACVPPGTPRLMTRVYPIQWLRDAKGYVLVHEYDHQVRWIYMDGRKAPTGDDLIPTFNGYSVGHWEGAELVVETTGFKAQSEGGWPVWLEPGVRATPRLKLVERYRLREAGAVLEVELTMTDPHVLAKPWVAMKRFDRKHDVDLMEFTCLADENEVTFKPDGSTTFKGLTGEPK